jgi:3-(3-hydroxy-phenyl)propionate hydroxylase
MALRPDKTFPYATPPGIKTGRIEHVPVIIVGAGPVGLTAAIDLALHGIECILLDDNNCVSTGSRAICWAKRTLEIMDRLGVGDRLIEKGVTWKVGRLFHGEKEVYSFNLLPEAGHKMPAFINLQQYYLEEYLIERINDFKGFIQLRWKNRASAVEQKRDKVIVTIETPEGSYKLSCDYLLACDGAHSSIRSSLELNFAGEAFEERFLIADVVMEVDFPSERWFWFDPPFHSGQTALLHRQPDNVYRIDLELGPHADPHEEKKPEKVIPRIKAMVGKRDFEFDWVSVYSLQCRKLDKFVHGRVIFAGDAAHVVSIFGARGGNAGIQDADNLIWKLAALLKGKASQDILASYDEERVSAAEENALITSRTARFMTPHSRIETVFRKAVLDLAETKPFARRLVNSGRLSTPHALNLYSLQTPSGLSIGVAPGLPCPDAPLLFKGERCWLLNQLGHEFCVLTCGFTPGKQLAGIKHIAVAHDDEAFHDMDGFVALRYGQNITYLIRPDQHVAAQFSNYNEKAIHTALQRAMGRKHDT